MELKDKNINLVLGGGGVKGIAYLGVFESAEQRGYIINNMAGVSAGSLAGAFKAAGYTAAQLKAILYSFDLKKVYVNRAPETVPIVARYLEFYEKYGQYRGSDPSYFFMCLSGGLNKSRGHKSSSYRRNILESILTFGKEGCLCDGDYLEDWVYRVLLKRGIRTFGDLRGGLKYGINPDGYRIVMTAVDINRGRLLFLPYDIQFYGIDPDKFEVAEAVRMSISVPFAFKPVEIKKVENGTVREYNIVDGGVFDSFPHWAVENTSYAPSVGFKLDGGESPIFNINAPLNVLRYLISLVHDLGIPKNTGYIKENVARINTSKVPFLKFDLNEQEKNYLYNSGKSTAEQFFTSFEQRLMNLRSLRAMLYYPFRRRYF
ncbi:MAG: patatin-like phospholipase family protein [Clostridiales bacterium]|nr:patatin-like phospholipase family protein [Eubacteriales bacterium]MDH7565834.1 patatin-like phospholipase family protein [Clostridiales bacterium]